jgi:transposase
MKKPPVTRHKEKSQIEQLSQAELVEMVLGLQKIMSLIDEAFKAHESWRKTKFSTASCN